MWLHKIAAINVDRIELEFHSDALHQAFQREINLRPAEAAH